ncbi:MAG: potassium transporter Kef [Bacteroidetes bacterium]|jgi:Kef-type K+ transport system membrane component KefB|nr:potassium transporter Kef [Bacteroidota bacterium]
MGFTVDLAIILLAATLVGFVARQTGQPTIIAYILAGVALGPAVLGVVEVSALTDTLSELGLAFLLFLLGIKMRIDEVRHILTPVLRISFPQMAGVGLAGWGIAWALGFTPLEALIIGLAVMYSSTAVVIKMLTDKDEATSLHGKIDVGILLVQDIVVVILLAVLAAGRPDSLGGIATTLVVVLTLVALIGLAALAASRYALPGVFRRIADNKQVFFLVALSWAFLFVLVSKEINVILAPLGIEAYLSIEMGAFLAGLAIAQLPYSKELQDRINPLTDLFVMVFFVTVALDLEARELLFYWQEAVLAALVLMPVKFAIFFSLIHRQDFRVETTFLGSISMIQISEFGIIVGVAAFEGGFVAQEVLGFLTLLALITMGASVYFIAFSHALYERAAPYLDRWEQDAVFEADEKVYRDHAVVIGYDPVTRSVLPLLAEHYDEVVVVDRKVKHIQLLKERGFDAIYGDFRNATIRKDAALKQADFVLSSSVEPDVNKALLQEVHRGATVFVEAETVEDARELYRRGAHCVVLSEQFAGGRLAAYLRAYLKDEATFKQCVDADIGLLRSVDPLPDMHKQIVGGLDD